MLKFTSGVRCPKSAIIIAAVSNAWAELDLPGDCFVTSMNDAVHMRGSKHYTDDAADFRTRTLTAEQVRLWAKVAKRRLGSEYDVVVEKDHLHVEADSKK